MSDVEHVKQQVRAYIGVFIALCVCTVITVLVSYVDFGSMATAIAVGLAIAMVKGGLVALIFMHLNHEKGLIYFSLGLTGFFFFVLLGLPLITHKGGSYAETHMYERDGGPPIPGAVVIQSAAVTAPVIKDGAGTQEGGGDTTAKVDDGSKEPTPPPVVEKAASTVAATEGGAGLIKGKVVMNGTPPPAVSLLGQMVGDANCAKLIDPANPPMSEAFVTAAGAEGEGPTVGNVLVYVSAGLKGRQRPGKGEIKFDQKGCIYSPHLVGIQVGQDLIITNSDTTLHNVHTRSKSNGELNSGQGAGAPAVKLSPKKPELCISVKCDVHPWMNANVGVFDHPFFVVTGVDGTFELPKLPAGKYTVSTWHEAMEPVSIEVDTTASAAELKLVLSK